MKDLYDTLGLNKNAGPNEIKKGYRKMAIKYHPDKNQGCKEAEKKFKEVGEAYEILSNQEKKEIYDRHGYEAVKENNGGMNNPHDIFSNLFRGGHGGMRHGQEEEIKPLHKELNISLKDVYNQKSSNEPIAYKKLCHICNGKGLKKGCEEKKCRLCEGRGVQIKIQRQGPMVQQFQIPCGMCNQTGKITKEDDKCTKCRGNKFMNINDNITIDIPRGSKSGEVIHIERMGDEDKYGIRGDVVYHLNICEEYGNFTRQNDDLILNNVSINLYEALIGTTLKITHLDGKDKYIEINTIIDGKSLYKVCNLGMPVKDSNMYGELYISFDVKYPDSIEDIVKLSKVLNQNGRDVVVPDGESVRSIIITSPDELHNDSDEECNQREGHGQGGEGVQCAQQ